VRQFGPLILSMVVLAACTAAGSSPVAPSPAASAPPATEPVDLTILAAASLRDALDAVSAAYASDHPTVTLTIATDSSAVLATQILEGAPADVFLSADETNPAKIVDGGLADGPAIRFAGNELTIVVPSGSSTVTTAADLAKPGVKVIAAGAEVPITKYASQVVDALAGLPGYPPDLAAAYAANVVSREDNVKAVVAKIELGEGDAAIVFATDATASGKVDRVDIPADAYVRATYAGVVIGGSDRPAEARAFMDWLSGGAGQAILAEFGFLPPGS